MAIIIPAELLPLATFIGAYFPNMASSSDLSHNVLQFGLSGSQFSGLPNLLDLYLGHNELAWLDKSAFVGLQNLQVLELNHNKIAAIHELTFEPLAASLRHLNLAHNAPLLQLSPVGLQSLISFKAYGNPNLRLLPELRSARRLALTYAYHCCDHLDSPTGAKDKTSASSSGSSEWRPLSWLLDQVQGSTKRSVLKNSNGSSLSVVPDHRERRQVKRVELHHDRHMIDAAGWLLGPMLHVRLEHRLFSFPSRDTRSAAMQVAPAPFEWPTEMGQIDDSSHLELIQRLMENQFKPEVRHKKRDFSQSSDTRQLDLANLVDSGDQQKVDCRPAPSPFLPCRDLFDSWWLRVGVWCVFVLGLVGNSMVILVLGLIRQTSASSALTSIMWLVHSKRHIDVPRFLVINLAIADLLMALYLGALALVDLNTLGEFKLFAIKWQYSTGCQLAGFLAVLSSELSVFILAIITLERNYAITNAVHLNRRLSLQKAILIMSCGYAFALAMALMPLNGVSDYRKFSICLPLDAESSAWSQMYVITLISMNGLSFMLLLGCYLRMYCAIRGSQAWNANDLRIAKRMSILVLVDFLCWMPIIAVSIASLFGHHLIDLQGIKALTIFVLPLNSVANPFLYAITTKKFKRDLDTLMVKASRLVSTCFCIQNQEQATSDLIAKKHAHHQIQLTRNQLTCAPTGRKNNQAKRCDQQINKHRHAPITRRFSFSRKCGGVQLQVPPTCSQPSGSLVVDRKNPGCYCSHAAREASFELESTARGKPKILLDRSASLIEQDHDLGGVSNIEPSNDNLRRPDYAFVRLIQGHNSESPSPSAHSSSILSVFKRDGHPRAKSADPGGDQLPEQHDQYLSTSRVFSSPKQSPNRCVSALGQHQRANEASNSAFFGGSHDPMVNEQVKLGSRKSSSRNDSANKARSLTKLTRSITQRLLFSPIAKAWSSIQSISLNQAQSMQTFEPFEQDSSPAVAAGEPNETTRCNSRLIDVADGIDDFLPVSEPTLILLDPNSRLRERRMSRSCEFMAQRLSLAHEDEQQQVGSESKLGCSNDSHENEITSGNYDDDQRILLAAINRIAGKQTAIELGAHHNHQQYLFNGRLGGNPSRSTRCRSWSPALLSKLENCISQIRSKIPRRSPRARLDPTPRCKQQVEPGKPEGEHHHQSSEDEYMAARGRRLERCEDSNEENQIAEVDQFDEGATYESIYTKTRRTLFKYRGMRQPRGSNEQQSFNSDTLSTRTCGTVLTNMSDSFDSAASIPISIVTATATAATVAQLATLIGTSTTTVRKSDSDDDVC